LNFFLILPLAIATATQHVDQRHTSEKDCMMAMILLSIAGPGIVGSTAINLLGGLRSGLQRLVLAPGGVTAFLRAGMGVCLLLATAITLVLAGVFAVSHVPMSTVQWFAILAASVGGNLLFMQLGVFTSLRAPRPVDLHSISGWGAYSFAGGTLTFVHLVLAMLCAYVIAYGQAMRNASAVAIGIGVVVLCIGIASIYFGRRLDTIRPAQQEVLLEAFGRAE
jgi:hypothetical protein